jgi:Tol biopolymer transport system component
MVEWVLPAGVRQGGEFSPEGSQIAFISDRDGKQQVYLLHTDGGEARKLTDFKRGVGGDLA